MKKYYWVLLFCLLPITSFAQTQFSNVIVFGDSLSDAGNLPERPFAYIHTPPKTITDLTQDFYVPLSNPINKSGYRLSIINLFHVKNHAAYQWPELASRTLLPRQPKINQQPRQDHSLNWPSFFLSDSYQDGLTQDQSLMPWTMITSGQAKATINTSIDYAWVSALSINGCTNPDYIFSTQCSRKVILNTWKAYTQQRTEKNRDNVHIPGTIVQVNLFLQDAKSGLVQVGPNTLYTLWVGGNDMAVEGHAIQTGTLKEKIVALYDALYKMADNNYTALNNLLSNKQVNAKHIYLFTMYNPAAMAPEEFHASKAIHFLSGIVSSIYARSLQTVVNLLKKRYPGVSIQVVPTYQWFKSMSQDKAPYNQLFPKSTLGKACALHYSGYEKADTPVMNCRGYLFWNGFHPTSATEQIIGYLLEQEVERSLNQPVTAEQENALPTTPAAQRAYLKQQIFKDISP